MAKYPVNKGIGRSPEFKGLKSQSLFIFAGGLLALFVVFVIMYMAGKMCIRDSGWKPAPCCAPRSDTPQAIRG